MWVAVSRSLPVWSVSLWDQERGWFRSPSILGGYGVRGNSSASVSPSLTHSLPPSLCPFIILSYSPAFHFCAFWWLSDRGGVADGCGLPSLLLMVPLCADCNGITDAGLQDFSDALKRNNSVTSVDFSCMCDCALLLVGRWWRRSALCVCLCVCVGSTSATDSPFPFCLSHVGGGQSLSPCVVCVSLGSGEGLVSVSLHPRVLWCTRELLGLCLPLTHSLSPSLPLSIHNSLLLARLSFLCILVVVRLRRCCRWVWPSFPLVDGTAVCRLRRIHGRRFARLLRCAEEEQQRHVGGFLTYVRLCVAACWTMVASVRCVCVCVCVSAHIQPVTLLSPPVCLTWVAVSRSLPVWSVSPWDQERGWFRSPSILGCYGVRGNSSASVSPSLTHSLPPSLCPFIILSYSRRRPCRVLATEPAFHFCAFWWLSDRGGVADGCGLPSLLLMVPLCAGCDGFTDAGLRAFSDALKSNNSVTSVDFSCMCDCALLLVGRWWRRSAVCVCVCVCRLIFSQ